MAREMKDSGIEWIGEIPESWDVIKFKYLFSIIGGNGFPDAIQGITEGDYPFCKVSDINGAGDYVDTAVNWITRSTAEQYKCNIIPRNSIIMAKIGAALAKNHRKINSVECCIDNNTQALVSRRNDGIRYLLYLSKCIDMNWFDNNSTVPSINNQRLLNFFVPDVLPEEQKRISAFLDSECSHIDEVIDKTKASIEEYKKLKQAVITHAVTKGIRSNRKMKDSGIEWLGKIPADWGINTIFQFFMQVKNKNSGLKEKNLLSLSYGKIKRKNIETTEGLLPESFDGYNIIEADDIVLRLTDLQNDQKSLRVGISTERGIVTSAYVTMRNRSSSLPRYLYYYLHSFDVAKGFYGMGGGVRQGLNWDGLKWVKLLTPPVSEQQEIVDYCDEMTEKMDALIDKKERFIKELEIYKKSIIFEYVTGKKEVS